MLSLNWLVLRALNDIKIIRFHGNSSDQWLGISCEIALRWMSLGLRGTNNKSILLKLVVCCHLASIHFSRQCRPRSQGPVSIRKTILPGMAISMLKIRRPLGRLIFNMGIAIPGKTVFLIETAPCLSPYGATRPKLVNRVNNTVPTNRFKTSRLFVLLSLSLLW